MHATVRPTIEPIIRLGLELPPLRGNGLAEPSAGHLMSVAEVARLAEDAAMGALWLVEGGPGGLDPVPLAGALSQMTTTLGLGVAVRPSQGRHPSVVAREITTIDRLAPGRAAVALVEDLADALDAERLGEATSILRLLWSEEEVTVIGRHYRVTGLTTRPRPTRPGGPPIVAGIMGLAEHADPFPRAAVVETSADAYVTGGGPREVAGCRTVLDAGAPAAGCPALLWRGALTGTGASPIGLADSLLDAGADGLIAVLDADAAVGGRLVRAEVVHLLEVTASLLDRFDR